jgi:hypothetical protein
MAYTVEQLERFKSNLATGTLPEVVEVLAIIEQLLRYEIPESDTSLSEHERQARLGIRAERNP